MEHPRRRRSDKADNWITVAGFIILGFAIVIWKTDGHVTREVIILVLISCVMVQRLSIISAIREAAGFVAAMRTSRKESRTVNEEVSHGEEREIESWGDDVPPELPRGSSPDEASEQGGGTEEGPDSGGRRG